MDWACQHSSHYLSTIHIRDWDDPECSDQTNHLAQFGRHCIQGSSGAGFIFDNGNFVNERNTPPLLIALPSMILKVRVFKRCWIALLTTMRVVKALAWVLLAFGRKLKYCSLPMSY